MVAYADTSFIASLYLPQNESKRALQIIESLTQALPVTPLLELEFRNALSLAVLRKEIEPKERMSMLKTFESHIQQGNYKRVVPAQDLVFAQAKQLIERYTAKVGARSLDILHLASAQVMGAKQLITFDKRQALIGKAEGLKIISS